MAMNMGSGAGRRGAGGSRGRAPMADINVTPFVDVMLVLLIIFMVTAPLLVTGVPVDLPESRANALDQDQEPVQISIENTGQIFVDDEALSGAALETRLADIAATQTPDNPRQIMLRGDKSLNYGLIMGIMGELNRAGLNRVSMVTSKAPAPVQSSVSSTVTPNAGATEVAPSESAPSEVAPVTAGSSGEE